MEKGEMVGRRIILRPLCVGYIDAYLEKFSPIIRSILHVDSVEAERAYLLERIAQQEKKETLFFCIFDRVTQQLVGAIEIRDPYTSRGQLYCWVNEKFWGTNRFSEAMILAARAYFMLTGYNFLTAKVDISNKHSYFALKSVGFSDSGLFLGPYGKQYELILRKKK